MKKAFALLMTFIIALSLASCSAKQNENTSAVTPANSKLIRLSTTDVVNDSGILSYLLPVFEKETGYKVEVTSGGSGGAAVQNAIDEKADVILIHSKASEDMFVSSGYGIKTIDFMQDYFVIVGPENNPAGIEESDDASSAFAKIRSSKSDFISRGDRSRVHIAEKEIWGKGNIPSLKNSWYISTGMGMRPCLKKASERGAYCLADKLTYYSMKDELKLKVLLENREKMKTTFSLIAVNPKKVSGVNFEGANALIDWLLSDEAGKLTEEFGNEKYGTQVYSQIKK